MIRFHVLSSGLLLLGGEDDSLPLIGAEGEIMLLEQG